MREIISESVRQALIEDVGDGDITADLLSDDKWLKACVIAREPAIVCGVAWFDEVYCQLSSDIKVDWKVKDGEAVAAEQKLCVVEGPAKALLTGERCALNFLQLLSGTATVTAQYVKQLKGTKITLLDTRKTIPGLRVAQKHAVKCGGGENHRMGLYDAFLIKENHIMACGSITKAIKCAREMHADKDVEVEVENLDELSQAIEAGADVVMLDNFTEEWLQKAVAMNRGQTKLEVSGNIDLSRLKKAELHGIDYVSVGALTKHVRAVDISMRVMDE